MPNNGFNTRKGEFVEITAAGTDGITATPIPSLADLTTALVSYDAGENGVRLPEGSVGDVVEIVAVNAGNAGPYVQVFHPDQGTYLGILNGGVAAYRRMPDSVGSISWMRIYEIQ